MCLLKKTWDAKTDRYPTRILKKVIIGQCSNKSEMLASKCYKGKYASGFGQISSYPLVKHKLLYLLGLLSVISARLVLTESNKAV